MKLTLFILLLLSISFAQAQTTALANSQSPGKTTGQAKTDTKSGNKLKTKAENNNHDSHHSSHSHYLETSETSEKTVSSDKKFVSTPELKVRMEKILDLMRELEAKSKDKKLVIEYGSKLNTVVNDIFKTCKLAPAADAAIHPTLGLIVAGAADFKNGDFEKGHKKIHEALVKYQKQFAHEGWKH